MSEKVADAVCRCDRSDCEQPAVAIYEGAVPPSGSFRFGACDAHAPDVPPVRDLEVN
jgi:hypothetical protein